MTVFGELSRGLLQGRLVLSHRIIEEPSQGVTARERTMTIAVSDFGGGDLPPQ